MAAMASGLGSWYIDRGAYDGGHPPDYYREFYSLREPTLYNALSPKLGVINPDLLLIITEFYSNYEAAIGYFPRLFKNKEQRVTYGVESVIGPAIRATEDIEDGLRRIERLGGIKVPASKPSTGRAKEALDLADDMRPDHD